MFRTPLYSSQQRYHILYVFLFGALFLVAPLYYHRHLAGGGLFLPFNILVWFSACLVIFTGVFKVVETQRFQFSRVFYFFLFLLITTTSTGFFTSSFDPVSWLFRVLALLGGILFVFSVLQLSLSVRVFELCLHIILASVLLQAAVGLFQILFDSSVLAWLPFSPTIPSGIFQQINVAASYQATGLSISLYLISRPSFKRNHWLLHSLIYVSAFSAAAVVTYSGSRVGMLGALTALGLLLCCRIRLLVRNKRALIGWLLMLLVGCFVGSQYGNSQLQQGVHKLGGTEENGRLEARISIYNISLELFKESPWVGHGAGSFEKVYQDKKSDFMKQDPNANYGTRRTSHPHNELLYWMVEGGLVSLSGMIFACIAIIVQLFKIGWSRGGAYGALLFPIALHTQVEYPFYLSSLHWFLFLFFITMAVHHSQIQVRLHLTNVMRKTLFVFLALVAYFVAFFFSQSLVSNKQLFGFVNYLPRDLSELKVSSRNLYFSDYTEFLQMQTYLEYAETSNNKELLAMYVQWAEETLKTMTEPVVYGGLALAYHLSGRMEESGQILTKGLSVYPNNKELAIYKARILKTPVLAK